MIKLKTIYGYIDINVDEKLTIEENSPFIDKENRRGLFSLPFNILGTPNNLRILGNYSLEENAPDLNIPCTLISDDVVITEGFIYLNSTKRNLRSDLVKYQVTFSNESGLFAKKIENLTIRDCYKYQESIPASTSWCAVGVSTNVAMLPTTTLVNDTYVTPNPNYSFPLVAFRTGIDETTTRSTFKFANFNRIAIVTLGVFSITDPLVLGHGAVRSGTAGYFLNCPYHPSQLDANPYLGPEAAGMGSYIIPFFYYHKVLTACFEKVGYSVTFNFKNQDAKDFFERIQILNNYNILRPIFEKTVINNANVDVRIWEDATEINSDNHLPDLAAKEFINDFMLKFCTYAKFDGNKVSFDIIEIDTKVQAMDNVNPDIEILPNKNKNIVFKYNYPNENNPDNAQPYAFTNYDNAEKKEVISILAPVNNISAVPSILIPNYINVGTYNVSGTALNPILEPFQLYEINAYIDGDIAHPVGDKIVSISGITTDSWYENQSESDCPFGVLISNYIETTYNAGTSFAKQLIGSRKDIITGFSLAWTDGGNGLIEQNYGNANALYVSGRKAVIKTNQHYIDYLNFDWEQKHLIHGQLMCTAKRKYNLPLSKFPIVTYELYQL